MTFVKSLPKNRVTIVFSKGILKEPWCRISGDNHRSYAGIREGKDSNRILFDGKGCGAADMSVFHIKGGA